MSVRNLPCGCRFDDLNGGMFSLCDKHLDGVDDALRLIVYDSCLKKLSEDLAHEKGKFAGDCERVVCDEVASEIDAFATEEAL